MTIRKNSVGAMVKSLKDSRNSRSLRVGGVYFNSVELSRAMGRDHSIILDLIIESGVVESGHDGVRYLEEGGFFVLSYSGFREVALSAISPEYIFLSQAFKMIVDEVTVNNKSKLLVSIEKKVRPPGIASRLSRSNWIKAD